MQRSARIADIEVLRAIAVLFVIVHHAGSTLLIWPGNGIETFTQFFNLSSGVNIFFVISGFVIARSILPTLLSAGSFSAFRRATFGFWIRRAWRLLPSAWLWLILIELAAIWFNRSGAFMPSRTNFAALEAGMLNVANFRFAETFAQREYGASFPYWSLSLEEQFYLLLPVTAFIFRRYIGYFAVAAIAVQWMIDPLYYSVLMNSIRTDGLLMGVLLALWSSHESYRRIDPIFLKRNRLLAPILVVALLAALAVVTAGKLVSFNRNPAPVTIVCTILVLIASYDRDYIMPAGALKRAMIWIGSRSYGLYLIHIPAYCLTREIWYRLEPAGTIFDSGFTLPFVLTAGFMMGGLCELNYRFVEQPLRIKGARIAERWQSATPMRARSALPRGRWLIGAVATGWAATLVIAETGRSGWLDRLFDRPVRSGQELVVYPTFQNYVGKGWGEHEPWGFWSIGGDAVINIPVSRDYQGRRTLIVKGSVLAGDRRPSETVAFRANGVEIGRYTATIGHPDIETTFDVPDEPYAQRDNLRIDIVVDQPLSPYELGLSLDQRKLGFGLVSMKLQESDGR